jgi:NADH dehydrogenase/NADH:ubiquinone oxidoreductase subunit G
MSFLMTINGKRVKAREGEMVLDTTRRLGIDVPTLCVHEAVEPFGACRLCMVEVTKEAWNGWKGLMTACLYPAAPDLIIETHSERVLEVRATVLDLLLARCPESDVIQKLAAEHGVTESGFAARENPDLCILCGLCVRICAKAATSAIATIKRGHDREVGTPWEGPPPDCIGCLACAHVCPTGHITFKELGLTREIWGRTFEMQRCGECGRPLPITVEQAAFLVENRELDESYFSTCADCLRKSTALTMDRIASWNAMGMVQDPKDAEVSR